MGRDRRCSIEDAIDAVWHLGRVGRVIAALAADSQLMRRSGGTFITAELAAEYGITDLDGKAILSLRAQRGSAIWQPIADIGRT